MGNADETEGEGRWGAPDSATCFLSSISAGGVEESSSMSSPEKEKLNADMLDFEVELVIESAREVEISRMWRRKGNI
jgi:hypothetical protein